MKCMLPATAATTITIFFFLSSHFFVVSSCIHHLKTTAEDDGDDEISSSTSELRFPSNFLFGAASSAYQYEGAYLSDGKGLNNWDTYTHISGKIIDGSTGDVATDHYHRYLEDVKLMTDLGLNGYRFSISWARILPRRYGGINIAGITFYTKLINALLLEGIQPFVTMSHFDIPQELQDRYGGWLSPQLKEDFAYYAEVCFKYFGKWVKHWVTFNEPNSIAALGYRYGQYPPGRCSASFGNCSQGDSDREPFIVAHNLILAHAAAVNLYRTKYQEKQGGVIGIVVHAIWFEPMSNSSADKIAVERAQSFYMNWFLDPIMFGEYPPEMRRILGPNLPKFTLKEQKILNKALDFIGINHYTSLYVKDCMLSMCKPGLGTSWSEGLYLRTPRKNGIPIGEPTALDWLYVYPQGMEKISTYVKDRYNNTPMFITENGFAQESSKSSSMNELAYDFKRAEYVAGYLKSLQKAIRNGADMRGYFAWSLLDNFEWVHGYTKRFGLYHIDYATLKRSPKFSVAWYKEFIVKHKAQTISECKVQRK